MRISKGIVILFVLGLVGCYPAPGETNATAAEWTLVADQNLALIDTRCGQGGDCTPQRNPFGCSELRVTVSLHGELCGACDLETGTQTFCGGFANGLPYQCAMTRSAGQACVQCADMRGTVQLSQCGFSSAVADAAPSCRTLQRPTGGTCELCVDHTGQVVQDTCGAPTGSSQDPDDFGGSDAIGGDTTYPDPDPGTGTGTGEGGGLPGGDDGGYPGTNMGAADGCADPATAVQQGQDAFVRAVNPILAEARMPAHTKGPPPGGGFSAFWGYQNWCEYASEDPAVHISDLFDAVLGDIDGHWYRFGKPRCSLMVQTAVHHVATREPICSTADPCNQHYINGITHESMALETQMESQYDCTGSPIVLDLDGNGISTMKRGTKFDLSSSGRASTTTWIRPGDALLARDVDGDGRISHGMELFGETSPGGPVDHGFVALAQLDDNGDGAVTPEDAAWSTLLVWSDDGDGVSTKSELASLEAVGIRRLELEVTRADTQDEAGSVLPLWARFVREDGTSSPMCDVYFALGRAAEVAPPEGVALPGVP